MIKNSVVDLFCGIGGLTRGFRNQNFKVVAGIDIDESCRYAFEKNNDSTFYAKDLGAVHSDFVKDLFLEGTNKILVGCAPCQAFSTYSQKYKSNDKWKMLYAFSRIIREVQPEIVSMENVPNLKNYNKGKVFKDFLNSLEENGYHVSWKIINCSEYGIPQKRKRLILFASKFGEVKFVRPSHKTKKITVREAISHLPPLQAGEVCKKDPLHRSRSLSEINQKRIKATPENGSWKDWPEELLLECHKKESGKTFGSVYGRMSWNDVAPTMTTQCTGLGNGRFGHPDQDRAISFREAAIFQSFPEDYEFFSKDQEFSGSSLELHIGNAVPVKLGELVAKSIRKHLKNHGR